MVAAAGLDRLAGDPRWCPHPVVVMGWAITRLRQLSEAWGSGRPWRLRLAGGLISLMLVLGIALAGWGVERLALVPPTGWPAAWTWLGWPLLLLGLASALAGRSLETAVLDVLNALPDLPDARRRLAWIVGRDVDQLDQAGILRAAAETAAENAVDGLFGPLFWMLLGAGLWQSWGPAAPGPLALAWAYKAASTLDSMLGYRSGNLRWLGTAGARLDDLLTWLPCRLLALTLPLAAGRPGRTAELFRQALRDGAPDPSPNAGVSQAIYAHVVGVQLGGSNRYGGQWRLKPLLAAGRPAPGRDAVEQMLVLSRRLEWLWLGLAGVLLLAWARPQ